MSMQHYVWTIATPTVSISSFGFCLRAAGDKNWTTNTKTSSNWSVGQPSSSGLTATFGSLSAAAYAGGTVNLDKSGQTIGGLVLSDSGQGGYTIGLNGGTVNVNSATAGSTAVTLASTAPSNLVPGVAFLGSYVQSVSGTSVVKAAASTLGRDSNL